MAAPSAVHSSLEDIFQTVPQKSKKERGKIEKPREIRGSKKKEVKCLMPQTKDEFINETPKEVLAVFFRHAQHDMLDILVGNIWMKTAIILKN